MKLATVLDQLQRSKLHYGVDPALLMRVAPSVLREDEPVDMREVVLACMIAQVNGIVEDTADDQCISDSLKARLACDIVVRQFTTYALDARNAILAQIDVSDVPGSA